MSFRDPSGITLQRPASWTVQTGAVGPLVVSIDGASVDGAGFRRNVNVLQQPLAAGLTTDAYLHLRLGQIAQTGGTVDDNRATTLGGLAARAVTWHVTKAADTHRFLSVWALRGSVAFALTYSSDARNFATPLPDVRRLVASIRLPE